MEILGVRVDNLSKKEMLAQIESFLSSNSFHQVATVNPEFILRAGEDQEFKNILDNCDLNIADGFGIKLAFWRYGKKLKCRIAGIDLIEEILKIASEKNFSVFLAVNNKGLSTWQETKDAIQKIYPSLVIKGENLDIHDTSYIIPDTNIVFCNFGAPQQEKFLNGLKNANIRLAMGVGGSFDYLTKKVPRAPKFMRQIGLEWLFRLFVQPNRWKRIWNAVVIFPLKIVKNK